MAKVDFVSKTLEIDDICEILRILRTTFYRCTQQYLPNFASQSSGHAVALVVGNRPAFVVFDLKSSDFHRVFVPLI